MMGENIESEMRPLPNAYGGTDQCQPCQRHFAYLFDPGEWNGVQVEIVGECADEIAEDDADQKIDNGQHDQGGDGHPWDRGDEPQHGMRPLTASAGLTRGVRGAEPNLRPALASTLEACDLVPQCAKLALVDRPNFLLRDLRNSSTLASTTVMPFGSSSFLALSKLSTDSVA